MFAYIPHELHLLQTLLAYRPEALNPFFIFLNNFDKGPTYCLIAIAVLTLLNPRLGKRCFVLLGLCIMTNYFLKNCLLQPRPLVLDPSLGLIETESRYGLPSGAAEAACALAVFILYYFKGHWVKIGVIAYVLLICLSRIYLGMHFISDIFGGLIVGYGLAKLFLHTIEPIEAKLAKVSGLWLSIACLTMMLMAVFYKLAPAYQMGIGVILAVIINDAFIKNKSEYTASLKRKLIAFILSVCALKILMMIRSFYPLPLVFYIFILVNVVSMITLLAYNIQGNNLEPKPYKENLVKLKSLIKQDP